MKSTAILDGVRVGSGQPIRLMGVINVSPESFYKGSVPKNPKALATLAKQMEKEGADFIDVGALSTAPYLKTTISIVEEAARLHQAISVIRRACSVPISVDTSRAYPAQTAFRAGATILNDVHGLRKDPRLGRVAQQAKGLILMAHPFGFDESKFKNPVKTVSAILKESLERARTHRIPMKNIVLDPGIGFFRGSGLPWWKWDLDIVRNLKKFTLLGRPLLVGISRKSFIGHLSNGAPPQDRLPGSLAATLIAVQNGATLVRTHDVAATKSALQIVQNIKTL